MPNAKRLLFLAILTFPNLTPGLQLSWTNSMLTLSGTSIPGGPVQIWYLEAFCRSGSTHRPWDQTTIPHQTTLLAADPAGQWLRLKTRVEPNVEVIHDLRAGADEVTFIMELRNTGDETVDVAWLQPCMRVGGFTGRGQDDYHERCFIFTRDGLRMLHQTTRTDTAIYRGGQVYVPAGINTNDVNPRPLSPDQPVNGLIGCVSADDRQLLAIAFDQTQELFQGVIVCIHNDPRVGGLAAGEHKRIRGKLYLMPNDPELLLARYERDFHPAPETSAIGWPRWRGPQGTGVVPANNSAPAALPEQPRLLWRKPVGPGLSSPVVHEDRIYFTDAQQGRETLHAFHAADGKELWTADIDELFKDAQSAPGPRATPTVDGSRVYAQSCRGELRCLATEDGRLLWRLSYPEAFGSVFIGERGNASGASRHGFTSAPLVVGDQLVVLPGSTNGAGVASLNKTTGAILWTSTDEPAAYASPLLAPVAGQQQLICFMSRALLGLHPNTGRQLWQVPMDTSLGRHVTTPVVSQNHVLVASHELGLVATLLRRDQDRILPEEAWRNQEAAFNFSSPVAVHGHLYGLGPRKNLICVEIATGKILWSEEGHVHSAPTKAYASFLVLNETILCLTDSGELIHFAANPKQFDLIAKSQVCGQNWCYPAYSKSRLYLRDDRQLYCYALE